MAKVFLGIGTNIGDKKANLNQAISELEGAGIKAEKVPSVYETEPVGVKDQGWFYNMVVQVETSLSAEDLLLAVKDIEKKMGRQTTYHWGPRLIDIDLLMYGDLQIEKMCRAGSPNTPKNFKLILPHPELKNRAFVIKPLLEIEPNATLPNGSLVKDFLQYTRNQKVEKVGQLH